eukprot:gene22698-1360_t
MIITQSGMNMNVIISLANERNDIKYVSFDIAVTHAVLLLTLEL